MTRGNGTDHRVYQMRCEISTGVEGPEDIEYRDTKILEIRRYRPEAKIGASRKYQLLQSTCQGQCQLFSELSPMYDGQLKSRIVQVSFGLLALKLFSGS